MFRNYQNVVQAFLHGDSFYSFPPTIKDANTKPKTKLNQKTKQNNTKQKKPEIATEV